MDFDSGLSGYPDQFLDYGIRACPFFSFDIMPKI